MVDFRNNSIANNYHSILFLLGKDNDRVGIVGGVLCLIQLIPFNRKYNSYRKGPLKKNFLIRMEIDL